MLTRNFDNLMSVFLCGLPYYTDDLTEEKWLSGEKLSIKTYNATIFSVHYIQVNGTYSNGLFSVGNDNYTSPSSSEGALILGSGDAEETYDDYKIDPITTLSVSGKRTNQYTFKDGKCYVTIHKVFINNTTADIVVKEAGFHYPFTGRKSGSSSNYSCYALLYRKKFDEPITIAANGGLASITLDIEIPMMMHKPSE